MSWIPINTFWQVMIDAANAMVTVPGEFGSFGHDYRGDTAGSSATRSTCPRPPTSRADRIDDALGRLDLERRNV